MSTFERFSTKNLSKVDINGSNYPIIPLSGGQLLCTPLYHRQFVLTLIRTKNQEPRTKNQGGCSDTPGRRRAGCRATWAPGVVVGCKEGGSDLAPPSGWVSPSLYLSFSPSLSHTHLTSLRGIRGNALEDLRSEKHALLHVRSRARREQRKRV